MMDAKALKKLVATCRKLGVKEFTSPELSFKLTDETYTQPTTKRLKARDSSTLTNNDEVATEELSPMDLLFYSTSGQDDLVSES